MAVGSLNKVCLIGILGTDPQVRPTTLGRKACVLHVQTSDYWHANPRTQWHRVVIFIDKLVEIAGRNLRKGSKVYVEGSLQTRKWHAKDGTSETWTTEIILSGFDGRLTLLDDRIATNWRRPPSFRPRRCPSN